MADIRIHFPTYSKAAETYDLLSYYQIPARIERTPPGPNRSCGYSLKIHDKDAQTARSLMSRSDPYFR